MKSRVCLFAHACAVLALLNAPHAPAESPAPASPSAVPITQVIAGTARKTGKKFLVERRVVGDVTVIGLDPDNLDYPTLLSVLELNGFSAVDDGKYVRVVPDANSRQFAGPVLTGGDGSYASAEYVTRILSVKNVPAAMLVPVLRPLVPQNGHLVALPCANKLILADTYANVKRMEKIVNALDAGGEPYTPEKCSPSTGN
ncbi:hypothetical protein GCM10011487_18870 [Steroidobacter agaridevorans]|uniref:DUF302 domain-containing protein n=1 Tax=Steroidobacter agaridevorans TaxID=2695856 RepID=A0A829Y982_9GAMM|nr:secretin N-terminal domain-containing protein [Steroidobacter agaridevorans]GFE79887.1 hypothetical protein GCM10011487_18870 [Steroidobacter agaridevorans]